MQSVFNKIVPLDWWKHQYDNNLQQHQIPGAVLGATALLVSGIWGKRAAIGFSIVTVLAYPFAHRAIIYLINLNMNEIVYAIAMLASQFIGLKYPFLSETSLFVSLLLTASVAIHSSQTRDKLEELEKQISNLKNPKPAN
jgi:hypothetical protein